ncbi:MAG TPA: hypothetical protein VF791_21025 [Pyrinomonadaceae bacterium]
MSSLKDRIERSLCLLLIICALPAFALGKPKGEFHLSLSLTRGERSRDSNSSTTLINVDGDKISYAKTFRGRQPRGRQPINKEFQVTSEEIERLKQLVKTNGLLESASIENPEEAKGFSVYFKIIISLKLDAGESLIKLSGPARNTKVKDEQLYKNADALVREVYKIIHAQDEDIIYQELVN